jgi:hypothetical protein
VVLIGHFSLLLLFFCCLFCYLFCSTIPLAIYDDLALKWISHQRKRGQQQQQQQQQKEHGDNSNSTRGSNDNNSKINSETKHQPQQQQQESLPSLDLQLQINPSSFELYYHSQLTKEEEQIQKKDRANPFQPLGISDQEYSRAYAQIFANAFTVRYQGDKVKKRKQNESERERERGRG